MGLPVTMDFEILHTLTMTSQCLEKIETHSLPNLPGAYQKMALATRELLTYGLRNTPEFLRVVNSSPVLTEILENITFEQELKYNRFPELDQVLAKAMNPLPE